MSVKFLTVLCLSFLAVQSKPTSDLGPGPGPGPEPSDIEYVIRLLEDLEKDLTVEVRTTIDSIRKNLKSIEDLSGDITKQLETELLQEVTPLQQKIAELEEKAQELGIDISDCVGDSYNVINNLPEELLGEAGECLANQYTKAELMINETISQINNAVSVDKYWNEIEECSERQEFQQEVCIAELISEISSASVDVPDEVALRAEEALGYLNALKTDLLVCTDGKTEKLLAEGDAIVANVTACALSKFSTTVAPTTAQPTTAVPSTTTTKIPTTEASTTEIPTTKVPTTHVPTTDVPTTTEARTTMISTTEVSTAVPLTTDVPTTIIFTTEAEETTVTETDTDIFDTN